MGRPKSSERKIYDSKFTKVEDEKFKCVSCGHILSSIKANNFLSHAKEHYKRCHPDEIEEAKSNEQAKQLTISDSFEVLPSTIGDDELDPIDQLFQGPRTKRILVENT